MIPMFLQQFAAAAPIGTYLEIARLIGMIFLMKEKLNQNLSEYDFIYEIEDGGCECGSSSSRTRSH